MSAVNGNDAAFAVLRRVRVQADTAPGPIDVPPFERQDFARRPPARGKREPDDVRQLARPLFAFAAVSVASSAAQMRSICHDRGSPAACCVPSTSGSAGNDQAAGLHREIERPPQRREFPIDLRRLRDLCRRDEGLPPRRREGQEADDGHVLVPGVNNLQTFGRWAFAELTDVYRMECAAGAIGSNFIEHLEMADEVAADGDPA